MRAERTASPLCESGPRGAGGQPRSSVIVRGALDGGLVVERVAALIDRRAEAEEPQDRQPKDRRPAVDGHRDRGADDQRRGDQANGHAIGAAVELVEVLPVAAEGQGIAWDPSDPRVLFTVIRSTREVVVSRLTDRSN